MTIRAVLVAVVLSACSKAAPPSPTPVPAQQIYHPDLEPPADAAADAGPAPAGRITVSSKQALDETTLTSDGVLAKIASAYMPDVKKCYKAALKLDATARGKVKLELEIDVKGHLVAPKVSGFDPAVDACITAAMASWTFDIPKDNHGAAQTASFAISLQLVPD